MFFVSGCDGAVVFDFAEEPLDCVAQFIEAGAEGRFADPLRHEPDIGPNAAFCHLAVQGIGVISAVGKQDIAWSQTVEHVGCAAPVVRLSGGDLQQDRQAIGIDKSVYLGRQPTF